MGAELFDDWIKISEVKSPQDAFNKLKEKAFYDYGHRGYTGTLAEKDDFTLVKIPAGMETKNQFYDWMYKKADENNKWDNAFMCKWKNYYIFFGWASS